MNEPDLELTVNRKIILAQQIGLRHPEMDIDPEFWEVVNWVWLWDHLTFHSVANKILYTVTDPVYLILHEADFVYTLKMSGTHFLEFMDLCEVREISDGNWLKEGF